MAKNRCPLGGDGTQDCYGCTYPCAKNKKKSAPKKRNRVVQILMDRDNMTEAEATKLVEDTRDDLLDALKYSTSFTDVEDILSCNLGLEPDYLFDII
jgi:hypothetical protein